MLLKAKGTAIEMRQSQFFRIFSHTWLCLIFKNVNVSLKSKALSSDSSELKARASILVNVGFESQPFTPILIILGDLYVRILSKM